MFLSFRLPSVPGKDDTNSISLTEEDERMDKISRTGKNFKSQPTFKKKKTILQKKSMMFKAITQAKIGSTAQVAPDILDLDVFTDDFIDESGKTIRWRRIAEENQEVKYAKGCCFRRGERILTEIEAEATLSQINEELSERLDQRARAISSWKRLKIVIVILKLCNGRIDSEEKEKEREEQVKK